MDAKLQMLRMCQLGRLLPPVDDIDTDDPAEIAEAATIVAEMNRTEREMYVRLRELREQRAAI